ncbi:MAG TPA: dihydrolipoamide acetyltransferase family protein [Solirubrobacteraceae bacterium]|nr:dihydrolipoamide acetyltransferase family protein [Solirubrobacteraceae bacterium]
MYEVVMPRLSDSMEEGTIVRWLKSDGDEVRRGEEIVEIETDKATMAYEADADGPLSIVAQEGETISVGAPIATIGGAGSRSAPASEAPAAAGATATAVPASNGVGDPVATASAIATAPAPQAPPPRVNASPVAVRTARRLGIDLAALVGSGPHGRVVKADVVAASAAPAAPSVAARAVVAAAPTAAAASEASGRGEHTTVALTRVQEVVARRMAESRATVPDFALQVDVDMTAALALRAELKAIADPAPSINDIVIKACAVALGRHPRANGSFRDDRFELHADVNVGFAVAAEDALVVPVVHGADGKSLGAIARQTRALAERVRSGTVAPAELSGGTFTVSNLGMYGIDRFEGIINAPQAAILCVGATTERAVVRDGQVAVAPVMTLTLACDHRILYGADAAAFLAEIRSLLEQPLGVAL